MPKVTTNVSIDGELKMKAAGIFKTLGLDMSTAVNMFLAQVVRLNGLPFDVKGSPADDIMFCDQPGANCHYTLCINDNLYQCSQWTDAILDCVSAFLGHRHSMSETEMELTLMEAFNLTVRQMFPHSNEDSSDKMIKYARIAAAQADSNIDDELAQPRSLFVASQVFPYAVPTPEVQAFMAAVRSILYEKDATPTTDEDMENLFIVTDYMVGYLESCSYDISKDTLDGMYSTDEIMTLFCKSIAEKVMANTVEQV